METKRFLITVLLSLIIPVWSVSAAVPDIAPFTFENQSSLGTDTKHERSIEDSGFLPKIDPPVTVSSQVLNFLYPPAGESSFAEMTDEELETALQTDLMDNNRPAFWKSREFLGILILAFGAGSVFAFLFGGSSGSGGANNGGGGGGNPQGFNSNEQSLFGDGIQENESNLDGGDNLQESIFSPDNEGENNQNNDLDANRKIPSGIPSNPEPSTFLLLGLGLLLPLLRKR